MELLRVESLDAGYNGKAVIKNVSFDADTGDFIGMVGPNACGKTTLLKALSGILRPMKGIVKVRGKNINDMGKKDMAQRIAFVPQLMQPTSGFTVEDTVLLGRTPYIARFSFETEKDFRVASHAIEELKIEDLIEKPVTSLSGGEFQRVAIARALAQEPKILLLDEPTSHLDFRFQLKVLRVLRRLREDRLIIATFHDLTLASRFCRKLMLINSKGEVVAFGRGDHVLTNDNLRQAFRVKLEVRRNPKTGKLRVYSG